MGLNINSKILDIGCGNNSAIKILSISNNFQYTGIDIVDYRNKYIGLKNAKFLFTTSDDFALRLNASDLNEEFDAVISAHNLEHCKDRLQTFLGMLKCLKEGGRLYLSFPCNKSIDFPVRSGTLNYYDDHTHVDQPPDFDFYIKLLREAEFTILFHSKQYKPIIMRTVGFLLEPISRCINKVLPGTWDYYGFESVIWAKKN